MELYYGYSCIEKKWYCLKFGTTHTEALKSVPKDIIHYNAHTIRILDHNYNWIFRKLYPNAETRQHVNYFSLTWLIRQKELKLKTSHLYFSSTFEILSKYT